jgi:hypothetical protein
MMPKINTNFQIPNSNIEIYMDFEILNFEICFLFENLFFEICNLFF